MTITFFPHEDELESSTIQQKLEVILESAERYKGIILDRSAKSTAVVNDPKKRMSPREISHAFNWDEIAALLRQIRDLPEANSASKLQKAGYLAKLAEVYELLRAAKMPKLEAVRIALLNESNQLRGGGAQVA